MTRSSTTQDFPGNVVGPVNAAQSLVAQYRYKPYGADNGSSPGTVPNPFRFAARQLDSETGLYYMRARYYDPQVGRFVSEDPIGLAGGINAYVYAGDNPVNGRDPSGHYHPEKESTPAHAAGEGGGCGGNGGGGGGGGGGLGGWFGAGDSPDYGDVSGGFWTMADVWDFYYWAMAQPGDEHSSDEWIAAGRPRYTPHSGDVIYLSHVGAKFTSGGKFLLYTSFTLDDIVHWEQGNSLTNVQPWGPTYFKLDFDNTVGGFENPSSIWYTGLMENGDRWWYITARGWLSGRMTVYVGLETMGVPSKRATP